ncbi:cytochrome c oxidase subunit 8B, mitochondrial [Synchiropus splendidus]|uniref:cytochrome c oxidase subunit 8B, mitochondrial n=1 Tax=Synchiropus splendidus TaxID=270530 RepID=UPI00237EDCDE|nr:cytochrome c oxidase subunit 8B, mitochondrial [Synchiropus splendidus]
MSLLGSARFLMRSLQRSQVQPVARITSKPAKETISAGEQAIALVTLFVTILGPSGWILAHLEDYKKGE